MVGERLKEQNRLLGDEAKGGKRSVSRSRFIIRREKVNQEAAKGSMKVSGGAFENC